MADHSAATNQNLWLIKRSHSAHKLLIGLPDAALGPAARWLTTAYVPDEVVSSEKPVLRKISGTKGPVLPDPTPELPFVHEVLANSKK